MGEFSMTTQYNIDPAVVAVEIINHPIKTNGTEQLAVQPELIEAQADRARAHLTPVDISNTRGTCIDERAREGLLSGEKIINARPSVPGGPDVYALAVGELTGIFGNDTTTGDDRLHRTKRLINAAGILSGAHKNCAANASFNAWISSMQGNALGIKAYAAENLGERYDETAMDVVINNATLVAQSGRYDKWSEDDIEYELGKEAGNAIETLIDAPHAGVTLVRNEIANMTVDQNALYSDSAVGIGSFVNDEWYAQSIEHAVVAGPEAERNAIIAAHTREAILASIAGAVPNELLYQIRLKNAT